MGSVALVAPAFAKEKKEEAPKQAPLKLSKDVQPIAAKAQAAIQAKDYATAEPLVQQVVAAAKSDDDTVPVICTQGKVIPDLISWWCERSGIRPDKSRNRKGSMWVMSLHGDALVAADHIGSPLPTKR